MSEHREEQEAEDLDVPESESDDVRGGLLLPAVQAAREAARRPTSSKHGGEIEVESWSLG